MTWERINKMSEITSFHIATVFNPFKEHERHHVTEKGPEEKNSGQKLEENGRRILKVTKKIRNTIIDLNKMMQIFNFYYVKFHRLRKTPNDMWKTPNMMDSFIL